MSIPWDAPATVSRYEAGLPGLRTDFAGTLREVVEFALSQANPNGDGYIVRLDDGSKAWEGNAIQTLAAEL